MKQKIKIVTFEEEKKQEYLKLVFNSVLIVACLICVIQAIFKAPMFFLIEPFAGKPYYFYLKTIFSLLFSGLSVFIPFYLYNKAIGKSIKTLFKAEHAKAPIAFYIFGAIAVTGIAVFIQKYSVDFTEYLKTLGYVINEVYPILGQNLFEMLFFIVLSAIIPAFLNEIAFRGIIVENLKKDSYTAAIILSSIIFSFNNISLVLMPYLLITGLILGWLYIKTNSIFVTITAHIAMNTVMSFILTLKNTMNEIDFTGFYSIIVPVCGIIGLLSLFILMIIYKIPQKHTEPGLTAVETVKTVLLSIGLWIFLFIIVFQLFFTYLDKPEAEGNDGTITDESKIVYDYFI